MRKTLGWIVGPGLVVLGLPGTLEDLRAWGSWGTWLVAHNMILPAVGLCIILWAHWPSISKRLDRKKAPPERDMSSRDLIRYLAHQSKFGQRTDENMPGELEFEVAQKIIDGDVVVWAQVNEWSPWDELPRQYFETYVLDGLGAQIAAEKVGPSMERVRLGIRHIAHAEVTPYIDTTFSRDQIKNCWPRKRPKWLTAILK